jgi:hypothetical protein
VVLAVVGAGLAGCPTDRPKPVPFPSGPPEDPSLPPPKVNLPPIPDLSKPIYAERAADGNWTVFGVRAQLAKLKGKQVTVHARVFDVYACPNPDSKEPPCQADHFWVADDPSGKPTKMMVVGYDKSVDGVKVPATGDTITVTGVMNTQEADGFIASDGLLVIEEWKKFKAPKK